MNKVTLSIIIASLFILTTSLARADKPTAAPKTLDGFTVATNVEKLRTECKFRGKWDFTDDTCELKPKADAKATVVRLRLKQQFLFIISLFEQTAEHTKYRDSLLTSAFDKHGEPTLRKIDESWPTEKGCNTSTWLWNLGKGLYAIEASQCVTAEGEPFVLVSHFASATVQYTKPKPQPEETTPTSSDE